jgi:hypothetical protein
VGELGRYSMGGSRIKRALLAAEGAHPELLTSLAHEGVRYLGFTPCADCRPPLAA